MKRSRKVKPIVLPENLAYESFSWAAPCWSSKSMRHCSVFTAKTFAWATCNRSSTQESNGIRTRQGHLHTCPGVDCFHGNNNRNQSRGPPCCVSRTSYGRKPKREKNVWKEVSKAAAVEWVTQDRVYVKSRDSLGCSRWQPLTWAMHGWQPLATPWPHRPTLPLIKNWPSGRASTSGMQHFPSSKNHPKSLCAVLEHNKYPRPC